MHRKRTVNTHVIVLLSGGIDSAAVLATYRAVKENAVEALFIDYGQPARRSEWAAAQAIAGHYNTSIKQVRLGTRLAQESGEFFARNALFTLLAGAITRERPLVIATGIHAASPYYDATKAFASDIQRLLDGYGGGAVSLGVPFLEMDKLTVVKFARRRRVPLELTYSCERRNAPSCGVCPSCQDRKASRVE